MPFRLGINYWPISSAMYWWRAFDRAEVDRDLGLVADSGFDSVRIFLLWEDFQPAPSTVPKESLQRLVEVADLAARRQLGLVPTLFTGHMSGVNWIPAWALDGEASPRFRVSSSGAVTERGLRSWYADPAVLDAQAHLARVVGRTLGGHPALFAYDLGNESSNCVIPPSRSAAEAWLARMVAELRDSHPTAVTVGLHGEDLEEDRRLGPREAGRFVDFLSMHGYPIYLDWSESPTDAAVLPFLGLLTRWMSRREVLFEELGAPAAGAATSTLELPGTGRSMPLLGEAEAAAFTADALEATWAAGMTGAMLWCFADYAEAIWEKPPLDEAIHERYFGLWRRDHSPKPAVAAVTRFAGRDAVPAPDLDVLGLDVDRYYEDPAVNVRRLYRRFREKGPGAPQWTRK